MLKHLFSLDDESTDIIKQLPDKKKSQYVRDAIKLKSRTLDKPIEKPVEAPKVQTFRVKI